MELNKVLKKLQHINDKNIVHKSGGKTAKVTAGRPKKEVKLKPSEEAKKQVICFCFLFNNYLLDNSYFTKNLL
jgi:hypothetical protein